MTAVRSILLVILAAIAEIGGGLPIWQGVREHKGRVWVGAGVIALGRYGCVATLQPDAASVAGRWSRPGTAARAPGGPRQYGCRVTELPISSPYRSTPGVPVSEQERNRVSERLNVAFTEGSIDTDDYNQRLNTLWSAATLGELVPVVEGLPPSATYAQPGIVSTGSGGQPGQLTAPRSGVPLTLAVGAGVVLVVLLLLIVLVIAL